MSWHQQPHIVSLGSEKNFSRFMDTLASGSLPGEEYYKELVAKAILFREIDARVRQAALGSHKANVVTYTVAWLSYLAGDRINLNEVWERQGVHDSLGEVLEDLARDVRQHITNPPPPHTAMNFGEWAKKEACWELLKKLSPPASLRAILATPVRREAAALESARRINVRGSDPEAAEEIATVSAIEPTIWFAVAAWAKQTENLAGWQRSLAFSLGRLLARGSTPTPRQAIQGVKLMTEAKEAGFDPRLHVNP